MQHERPLRGEMPRWKPVQTRKFDHLVIIEVSIASFYLCKIVWEVLLSRRTRHTCQR